MGDHGEGLPNDGLRRWYRFRHISGAASPGPWSNWHGAIPVLLSALGSPAVSGGSSDEETARRLNTLYAADGVLENGLIAEGTFNVQGTLTAEGNLSVLGTTTVQALTAGDLTLNGARSIVSDIDTSATVVSGGTSVTVGANIQLLGSTHATNPNEIRLRTGTTERLKFDGSAWTFGSLAVSMGALTAATITGSGLLLGQGNTGTSARLALDQTATGGRRWDFISATNALHGIPDGWLAIRDNTAPGNRAFFDTSGNFILGTAIPATGNPRLDVVGPNTVDTEVTYAMVRGGPTSQPGLRFGGFNASVGGNEYTFIQSARADGIVEYQLRMEALEYEWHTGGTLAADLTGVGTASLWHFRGDIQIASLGRFDGSDTPTDKQFLVYNEADAKWQAESLQFVRGTGDFKAELLADNTAVAYVFLDPGTAGAAAAPNTPGTPTVEVGHKAFVLEVPSSYVKTANFRYFEWQHCTGASCSSWAALALTTSRNLVHSRLTEGEVKRYRVRAVGRDGDLTAFATTGDNTVAAQSDTQAFGGVIAGEIATVDLTALAGDIGILISGQFRGPGNTFGINFGGVGGIPAGWTAGINFEDTSLASLDTFVNFESAASPFFIKHAEFELKHPGEAAPLATFKGRLDISDIQSNVSIGSGSWFLARNPNLAHGMTGIVPTDAAVAIYQTGTDSGGGFLGIAKPGFQLFENPVEIRGIIDGSAGGGAGINDGAVTIIGREKSGTGDTALTAGTILAVTTGGAAHYFTVGLSITRVVTGDFVVGTDPGGGQLLRVGGTANIDGNLSVGGDAFLGTTFVGANFIEHQPMTDPAAQTSPSGAGRTYISEASGGAAWTYEIVWSDSSRDVIATGPDSPADYVFEHAYLGAILTPGVRSYGGLLPLLEVENYTREHFHLPGPRAGRFDIVEAAEKIEESYLYLFDHEHRIVKLEREIARLRAVIRN